MAKGAGRHPRTVPTAEQLSIWRDFIETTSRLQTRLTARLQTDAALSPGDYAVLLSLSEADGRRQRPSDLAATISWERSRLSHHLARMERRGLIRREDCATDTRGAEVSMTEEGAQAFRRATLPHLRAIHELFVDALTPQQFAAVAEITESLRDRLTETDR